MIETVEWWTSTIGYPDRVRWTMILVVIGILGAPSAAIAATVLTPPDGEAVSSRPTFTFDFVDGSATIELSRSPETNQAGSQVGAFVDPIAQDFTILSPTDATPGTSPWDSRPLTAGRYYWHAQMTDYNDDVEGAGPWSQTRIMTVIDEPIVLAGWLVRAQRTKRTRACTSPMRITGRFNYEDNAPPSDSIRWRLALKSGTRNLTALTGTAKYGTGQLGGSICTRARQLVATLTVTDKAGHRSSAPTRVVTLPR